MKRGHGASRAWLKNKDALLSVVLAFSFVFYFVCLLCIPRVEGDGASLLRGCAAILALFLPPLFYLRTIGEESVSARKATKRSHALWRVLLFAIGSASLGVFLAQIRNVGEDSVSLFSRFAYPDAFSVASFAAMCAIALATVFLPFCLLGARFAQEGSFGLLLPTALFYAAFFFSPEAAPLLLLFGLTLAILRVQSGAFLPVLLCNLFFTFGGYGVSVDLFGKEHPFFLPPSALLLVTGLLALGCFLFAVDYRFWRNAWRNRTRRVGRYTLLWTVFGAGILVISIFLSLVIIKNIA